MLHSSPSGPGATRSDDAPLDRVLFDSGRVTVGEWRCRRTHANFADTGPTEHYLVAFPRTTVRIQHADRRSFVSDPTLFTMYNRGQRYRREAIDPEGDRCDWWAVDGDNARAIAAAVDAPAASDAERPFRFDHGPADAALYLRQRRVLHRLRSGAIDAVEAEEETLAIVARALAAARGHERSRARVDRTAHRDLAHDARALIGLRFRDRVTLAMLASALGVSAFHLCRVHRAQTGTTVHRHLTRLRLRASLEALEGRDDLCRIALDAGFASHSHFTAAFRAEFGLAPSRWRSSRAACT
jgi:AraC-like DNA-binding protein